MEILIFENTEYFYFFLLIPLVLIMFLAMRYFKKKALRNFGDENIVLKLTPMLSYRRPWIKMFLMILAISLIIMAAVNPKVGSRMEEIKREGVDIVVAIDVSRSMMAEDIKPNRLVRAKAAVSRLIDRLDHDRVGIVVFAGEAVTQVALTGDHSVAKMLLKTIGVHSVTKQGTAIGSAINRAMASFQTEDLKNKTIILISDGENHLDDPIEVAKKAAEQDIIIHTIGIGTPEGAPIPIYKNNQLSGYLKDNQNNSVISKYDEKTLKTIASVSGGVFHRGTGADIGLDNVLESIRSLEKEEYESVAFADHESRFHYFVALALLVLLLELFIFERKNKWIDKIRIFKV
ncbi:MAG: vWA domain-containing protein [Bacteroidota bacterium]